MKFGLTGCSFVSVIMYRDHLQSRFQTQRNHSGPLQFRQKHKVINSSSGKASVTFYSANSPSLEITGNFTWLLLHCHMVAAEDVSDGAVVQRKGRFKVFSADHNPKVYNLVSQKHHHKFMIGIYGWMAVNRFAKPKPNEKVVNQKMWIIFSFGSLKNRIILFI